MYIISHHFANVNGFLKNKPPFFCIKKGRHCDALLTDLSSYLNATIDFVLSSLGFGLLLIGFVVFYTSIAIHNTSGFLIDFVHTEQAVHPSQSVPSETFGLVRHCLLAILTNVRGFQVSYFRPYWDERINIYTRYLPKKMRGFYTPHSSHYIVFMLNFWFN